MDSEKKKPSHAELRRHVESWKTAAPTNQKLIGGRPVRVDSKPPVIDPKAAAKRRRRMFALVEHWKNNPPTGGRMIGGKAPSKG